VVLRFLLSPRDKDIPPPDLSSSMKPQPATGFLAEFPSLSLHPPPPASLPRKFFFVRPGFSWRTPFLPTGSSNQVSTFLCASPNPLRSDPDLTPLYPSEDFPLGPPPLQRRAQFPIHEQALVGGSFVKSRRFFQIPSPLRHKGESTLLFPLAIQRSFEARSSSPSCPTPRKCGQIFMPLNA